MPRGVRIGFGVTPNTLKLGTGVFQLQAAPALMTAAYLLSAAAGTFNLTGIPATFSGSGTSSPPSAPTNLHVTLMGQTSAGNSGTATVPMSPNYTALACNAATPGTNAIAGYNWYRSTALTGTYSKIGSTSAPAFADTAATLCINGTAGAGPQYYPANTYFYKVTAFDTTGLESALSAPHIFWIYKNGYNWGPGNFDNGVTSNYSDTSGPPNTGNTSDIKVTLSAMYGETLYYSGQTVTEWNHWVGAFNYLYIDLKVTRAAPSFQMYALRAGDQPIYNSSGGAYNINPLAYGPAPVVGSWATYKIPLAAFLTDYGPSGGSVGVRQNAFYKFAFQDQSGVAANAWFYDNMFLSAV